MHHHTISVPTLLARRSPAIGSLVCARLGDQELWELVNNTNELQNFHIHQTKICLARLPPGFADKDATRDPAIIATSHVPEFGTIAGVKDVDVWHDTLPVPPGFVLVVKDNTHGLVIAVGEGRGLGNASLGSLRKILLQLPLKRSDLRRAEARFAVPSRSVRSPQPP